MARRIASGRLGEVSLGYNGGMVFVAGVLMALAAFIAVGNLTGAVTVHVRQRRGDTRGFSCIPIFSALFCLFAWMIARDSIGLWAFVPTALDLATWLLIGLPFYLLYRCWRGD